jgi:hypothetical protein
MLPPTLPRKANVHLDKSFPAARLEIAQTLKANPSRPIAYTGAADSAGLSLRFCLWRPSSGNMASAASTRRIRIFGSSTFWKWSIRCGLNGDIAQCSFRVSS